MMMSKSSSSSYHTTRHLLLSLLERCSSSSSKVVVLLQQLKQVQAQIILSGLLSDTFVANQLIAAYASSHLLLPYCTAILTSSSSLPINLNAFSWNIPIRAYAHSPHHPNHHPIVISLYKQMLTTTHARPDNYTHTFLFKSCAATLDVTTGLSIFAHSLRSAFAASDVFVVNAAIHFFAVSARLDDARKLFDTSRVRDTVSWNTIINAYVHTGNPREALELFHRMEEEEEEEEEAVRPDQVTMIAVVSCCAQMQDLDLGRRFHRLVQHKRIDFTVRLTNSLMDMYVKCGSLEPALSLFDGMSDRTVVSWTTIIMGYSKFGMLEEARRVFDEMPERDLVPWNALLAGYVQCGRGKEALALFKEMQASRVKPNEITMITLLSLSAQLGALDMGTWVHRYIDKERFRLDVTLGTALVDMYAKCGNIDKSLRTFNSMHERNTLTWTAIVCGLATHGHGRDAVDHFKRMVECGLTPDEVTFVGVLSACCHAGLVDEGRKYFSQMSTKYGIMPNRKHYSCMVDLLGRAGLLQEAEEFINSMPVKPDVVVWGVLFFACRMHGEVVMGERAALQLLELDPSDSATYVLLANMYMEANMREEAGMVRELMKEMGVEKTPGCSSIELNGMVYEFMVRDKSHRERYEIYETLLQLSKHMEHIGNALGFSN
ncbi:pentatricopeptide repeat-containing protein, mitochondrial [Iris pallida]|uniref:Pentatricopeptide repeat-containing protein, mitochondrial n=1 Tax=Iris pallida TaxID=29817 RepID=A0AAX6EJ10_IRIPA|nr:pentatricopeptide repeat-containing protein, mitochondrial [Iris pallida]